jgi:hypothetical protein
MKTTETKRVRTSRTGLSIPKLQQSTVRGGSKGYTSSFRMYETDILDTDEDVVMQYYNHNNKKRVQQKW